MSRPSFGGGSRSPLEVVWVAPSASPEWGYGCARWCFESRNQRAPERRRPLRGSSRHPRGRSPSPWIGTQQLLNNIPLLHFIVINFTCLQSIMRQQKNLRHSTFQSLPQTFELNCCNSSLSTVGVSKGNLNLSNLTYQQWLLFYKDFNAFLKGFFSQMS